MDEGLGRRAHILAETSGQVEWKARGCPMSCIHH